MFSDFFNNCASKRRLYFAILGGLIIWFICKNIDITLIFFISIVLACSLSPIVDKMSKKMNRTFATIIVLFSMIILIGLLLLPILGIGIYEITTFANDFTTYIDNLDNAIKSVPLLQKIGITKIDTGAIATSFSNSISDIIGNILDFAKGISSAFLYTFTALIFIFFFIADKDLVKKNALKLFPNDIRIKTEEIIDNIAEKLGGYVIAQTCAILSVGVVMTLGLLIFRVDYAVLLGLITAVLDIIPVVGPAIALVICLIATYESGAGTLVVVTCVFILAQFIENNFVRPYMYNKLMNLHPIIIFLSLFLGAKYLGVLGVLFAPPIATAVCILLDELYIKKMDDC